MERLLAPAKLTLTLRVVGVRPDGFHLIDAEMTTLDLVDEIEIVETPGIDTSVSYRGEFADGLVGDGHDLVSRALRHVGRTARVIVEKNVPHGGGLGGGSSDCAAILRWAGHRDPIEAASLGADVPFCLVGGRARVRGIGEEVEAVATRPGTVTLVVPPFGVSTPAVYAAWDEMGGPTSEGPNDLEPAACRVEPRLVEWRDRIGRATGRTPVLAGSGSTWFVEGPVDTETVRRLSPARVTTVGHL